MIKYKHTLFKKFFISLCLVGFLFVGLNLSFATPPLDSDFIDFDDLEDAGITLTPIPDTFRSEFAKATQELCFSTIHYDLDRRYQEDEEDILGVHDEFHTFMNCLFNDAFSEVTYTVFDDVHRRAKDHKAIDVSDRVTQANKETFEDDRCFFRDKEGKKTDTKITVSSLHGRIKGLGFQTQCGAADKAETVKDHAYSSCQLGELVWNEYCGYQKYLWAKMKDDKTFQTEFEMKYAHNERSSPKDWTDVAQKEQTLYFQDLQQTKRALLDTLFLYQKFEQNFRLHVWFNIIYRKLEDINNLLIILRETFETYPTKFPNAARPPA